MAALRGIKRLGLGALPAQIINKHVSLQVAPAHYPVVGKCLLQAIREVLGAEVATDAVLEAWGAAYQQLADILIGAEEAVYAKNENLAAVAYTGTHDNDTVLGWWRQAGARERALAGSYLACSEQDVHWAMIRACCNSVAALAIFPLQDVLGLGSAHRMNVPGVLGGNWGWRFTWDMVGTEPGRVLGLIAATSGRAPIALARLPE